MRFGAHISSAGGLLLAIDRAAAMGAEIVQVHTQSPRMWRAANHPPETLVRYAAAMQAHPAISETFCHASYLINLGGSDVEMTERSQRTLVANLTVASAMGASGVVLHLGSHLGAGLSSVVAKVARSLVDGLDRAEDALGRPACPLLMENTAGAGGTLGRSFDELEVVLDAAGGDRRLGVCLDTQHLFASGISFDTLDAADGVVEHLDRTVGLDRLACLHVNDSKVPLGSNRDRHENLGDGHIGRRALGSLLAHPKLAALPAILEVPGPEGKGPTAVDLAAARAIRAAGVRRWRRRAAALTRPPLRGLRRAPDGRTGSPQGPPP